MRFEFVAKHRGIWPVSWICEALGVSRSGFHAWLVRAPSARARSDEEFGAKVRGSFISSYRTYGARRVWRDLLAEGQPDRALRCAEDALDLWRGRPFTPVTDEPWAAPAVTSRK